MAGDTNPLPDPTAPLPSFNYTAGAGAPPSFPMLDLRRKMALAMMAGKRAALPAHPITAGLFEAGGALRDLGMMSQLERQDALYEQDRRNRALAATNVLSGQPVPGQPVPAAAAAPAFDPARVPGMSNTPGVPFLQPAPGQSYFEGASETPASPTQDSSEPAASTASTADESVPLPPPRPLVDRSSANAQFQSDPNLLPRIAAMTLGETSSPREWPAMAASALNRAEARGIPAEKALLTNTGPNSPGYYPEETFRRGYAQIQNPARLAAFKSDVLDPILRGEDPGMQALGFAPTGNASGGVAERGVASGRYNAAGQIPGGSGETFVQQESPEQLARLAQARTFDMGPAVDPQANRDAIATTLALASRGAPNAAPPGGAAAALPPNPAIVRPEITPAAERMAQAAAAPTGAYPPGMAPKAAEEAPLQVVKKPVPPLPEQPSKREIWATQQMMIYGDDPQAKLMYGPIIANEMERRKQVDEHNKELFNKDLAGYHEDLKAGQEQARGKEKETAEVEKLRLENEAAGRMATAAARAGGLPNEAMKEVSDNYLKVRKPDAEVLAQAQTAIRQARAALSQGAVTGIGSEARINWSRLMGFLGMGDQGSDAANAQLFKSVMQPVVNAQRRAAAGNTNISDADIRNAERAAGADYKLEPKALHNLLNILEENSVKILNDYKSKVGILFGAEEHPGAAAAYGAPRFETEPQRLPAPPKGTRVQVWNMQDARRYPSGTELILPNGDHGTVP